MSLVSNRKLILFVLIILPTFVFADQSTICKNGVAERKIEVSLTEGSKLPCAVKYFKDVSGEGIVLWSAKNDPSYCENKAKEFTASLVSYGWECSVVGAPTNETSVPETVKTETSEIKKEPVVEPAKK